MKSNLFFNTDDRFYFLFDPIPSAFRNEEIHLRSTSSAYLVRTHIAKEFRCLHLITFTIWNENLVPDSWHTIRRSCSLSSFLLLTRCIEIPLPRSLTHLLTHSISRYQQQRHLWSIFLLRLFLDQFSSPVEFNYCDSTTLLYVVGTASTASTPSSSAPAGAAGAAGASVAAAVRLHRKVSSLRRCTRDAGLLLLLLRRNGTFGVNLV